LARWDYLGFYVSTGLVGKVTGTPATNALLQEPDYDPADFYPIKLVEVKATATTPSNPDPDDPGNGTPMATTLVWNENVGAPAEFNLTIVGADIAVTSTDPYDGTVSLEATNANQGDKMRFVSPVDLHTDDFTAMSWFTKLKSSFGGQYIFVQFFNGAQKVGRRYHFNGGSNGFNSFDLGYQKITIDKQSFNRFPSAEYNRIDIFYWTNASFDGWFFDKFQLHDGSGTTDQGGGTDLATDSFTDTTNFDNNLSDADDTVQKALDTLDDLVIAGAGDELIGFAFNDETTDIEAAKTVLSYAMPNFATVLTHVSVNLKTAPTGSTAIFDINEGGVSVLSTKISIDATETNSETAATPPVISDSAIAANAIITLDVDQKGSTIAGVAPKMWLYFTRA